MTAEWLVGRPVDEVPTPALLLDLDRFEWNIARMQAMVAGSGLAYRPHAKSHKSPIVAQKQLAAGATGICCAKLGEAEAMVASGVSDILITTPVVGTAKLLRLAAIARHARIAVVVDDLANIAALSESAGRMGARLGVLVEVDVGQGRCGVAPGAAALPLAEAVARAPQLEFRGLQGYYGSIQGLIDFGTRAAEVKAALDRLLHSAEVLRRAGLPCPVLTGGGTGSSPIDLDLRGLTELQPGSYVTMDASYAAIHWSAEGTPIPFECAVTVLAGVISRPNAERAVVDVGWKAVSCDSGAPRVKAKDGGWSAEVVFEFAGDEHGILHGGGIADLRPGGRVELIPAHSDTTVNLYDQFFGVRGGIVEAVWPITARGRGW